MLEPADESPIEPEFCDVKKGVQHQMRREKGQV